MDLYNYIRSCNKCVLCNNQAPVLQKKDNTDVDVFWVGLSAVRISDKRDVPLSDNTNSGKLISSIEFFIPEVSFYKTNLVKCLPLKDEKIRYPSKNEMKTCFFHLENEIDSLNPSLVFLLGKQVASFVLNKYGINEYSLDDDFFYESFEVENLKFIPIHHPSYILVYKRKRLQEYIKNIENIINECLLEKQGKTIDNQLDIQTNMNNLVPA